MSAYIASTVNESETLVPQCMSALLADRPHVCLTAVQLQVKGLSETFQACKGLLHTTGIKVQDLPIVNVGQGLT
jgi:hypothetical protein